MSDNTSLREKVHAILGDNSIDTVRGLEDAIIAAIQDGAEPVGEIVTHNCDPERVSPFAPYNGPKWKDGMQPSPGTKLFTYPPDAAARIAELKAEIEQHKQLAKHFAVEATINGEWRDRYMRDVEGLNNEGDPIGGDPPSGLRQQLAAASERLEAAETLCRQVFDDLKIRAAWSRNGEIELSHFLVEKLAALTKTAEVKHD